MFRLEGVPRRGIEPMALAQSARMREQCDAGLDTVADSWRPAADVVFARVEDSTVLLSLSNETYYTFDGVGTLIWEQLAAGRLSEELAHEISSRYRIPVDTAISDLSDVLRDLFRRGLIERTPDKGSPSDERRNRHKSSGGTRSPRMNPPSLLACITRLALVHALLRICGFRRTLRLIRPSKAGAGREISQACLERMERNMRLAAQLYPLGAHCLEQSLAILWLAKHAQADFALQIGVQLYPFMAHAWVEHRHRPLCQNGEYITQFVRLSTLNLQRTEG